LLPSERAGATKPLSEHLSDFERALLAKGTTEKQAKLAANRARRIVEGSKLRNIANITAGKVESYISELRRGSDSEASVSERTSNFYLGAMNQFCRWLVSDGRATQNPITRLKKVAVTDAARRRPLSEEEQASLIQATEDGPERFGMSGKERALLYHLALGTGFRASELFSLTAASFDLDSNPPTVALSATDTKNKRDVIQPITKELTAALKPLINQKKPSEAAFRMPKSFDTADMLREDLAAAREAWLKEAKTEAERNEREKSGFLKPETDQGRADFHSLRHTFGTALARAGVVPKVAMDLMRHSDINLTMRLYSHTVVADRAKALERLPRIGRREQPAAMTGTDGTERNRASVFPLCFPESERFQSIGEDSGGPKRREPREAQTLPDQEKAAFSGAKTRKPPVGFEPTTCGLQNRCSAN